MDDIILDGKDYLDLTITYSDKNNIQSVNGIEYLIDDSSIVNFDINPSSSGYGIDSNGVIELSYPFSSYTGSSQATSVTRGIVFTVTDYLREEVAFITGTVTATVNQVIKEDISVSWKIDYDYYKSNAEIITYDNYKSSSFFVFDSLINNDNLQNKDIYGNRTEQYTEDNGSLPINFSYANAFLFGIFKTGEEVLDKLYNSQYVSIPRITNIDETAGTTTVQFDYKILVWSADNNHNFYPFTDSNENNLYLAKYIKFIVQSNVITSTESKFNYPDNKNNKPYTLESNELMQYTIEQALEERTSSICVNKILENYSINRQIISFKLLNCIKYYFDDNSYRYLETNDLIKIKDESDNYIGQYTNDDGDIVIPYFEIIAKRPTWDGSYYMDIIAKQVYTI